MKFVSSTKISERADQLHACQQRIAVLKAELKTLAAEEDALVDFIVRSKGTTFAYTGKDGYQKVAVVSQHSRQILDQDKCKILLKARTPYTDSKWTQCKVDWVYE